MSKLRIKDAPTLPDVDGSEKIPTGGKGDYSVTLDQVKTFARGGLPQQLEDHINDTNNPHQVTKDQVGLGNVDNTSDLDKPISTETQEALDLKANTVDVDNALNLKADIEDVNSALNLKADKTYVEEQDNLKLDKSEKGISGGLATLDDDGKVPRAELPNFVDLITTVPTYKTVSDGVNPVTGVSDGAYFNVRSEDDDTVAIEYQNVGGSAVATGKSYPNSAFVQDVRVKASYFFNTVSDMVSANDISDGMIVGTKGYHNVFDDGGAIYIISAIATDYTIPLNNGLHAVFRDTFDIRKFGIQDNELLDQKVEIERALAYADTRVYEIDFLNFKIKNPKTHYKTTARGSVLRGLVFRELHKVKNLYIANDKTETLTQGVIPIIFGVNNPTTLTDCVLENVTVDPYVASFVENTDSSSGEHDGFFHGIYFDKTPTGSFQTANNINLYFKSVNFVSSAQSYNISASAEMFNSITFDNCGGEHLMLYSFLLAKNLYVDNVHTILRDDLRTEGRSTGSAVFHLEPENHNGEPIALDTYAIKNASQKIHTAPNSRGLVCRLHLIENSGTISFKAFKVSSLTDSMILLFGGTNRRVEVATARVENSQNSIFHVHGKIGKMVYDHTDINSFGADGAYVLNGGERDYVEINNGVINSALAVTGQVAQVCKELVCNNIKVKDETYGLMRGGTTPLKVTINSVELLNDSARLIETAIETADKSISITDLKIPNTTTSLNYGNVLYLRNANVSCDVNTANCERISTGGVFLQGLAKRVSLSNFVSNERLVLSTANFTSFIENGVYPPLGGKKAWDFANLTPNQIRNTNITVVGAKIGQPFIATFNQPLLGTRLWAEVTAINTVTVYHQNLTGVDVDLPSGEITVIAI